jgi:hypothetical protein
MSSTFKPPGDALTAQGMLSWDERIMLSWLTEQVYSGAGEIVELGVFVGSSTVSLASGLIRNTRAMDKGRRIHAYDLFAGEYEAQVIREQYGQEVGTDGSFLALYEANIATYRECVSLNAGDITTASWNGKPIEILFVDILKSRPTIDAVVGQFFSCLQPGRSIVIMQDYNLPRLPYSAILMEHFGDYFAYAGETTMNSVLFVNTKSIPTEMLADFSYEALPENLRLHYLMQAMSKRPTYFGRECIAHQIKDFLERGWT